eukprot:SAG11_NODE_11033_length_788_cov_2.040639_1_plen_106_part_10
MKGSNIQKLGFADIGIGPIGMKTLADAIPTIPGLVEVVISDNKCFGDKWKHPGAESDSYYEQFGKIHDIDKDQSGWAALCDAMKGSSIQKLGFADIGLGTIGMKTL